jgi:hypothetical protein
MGYGKVAPAPVRSAPLVVEGDLAALESAPAFLSPPQATAAASGIARRIRRFTPVLQLNGFVLGRKMPARVHGTRPGL